MTLACPARTTYAALACILALCTLTAPPTAAQDGPLGRDGLRGGREVGSALPVTHRARAAVSAGYAHTEDVLNNDDRHERVQGEVALAYHHARWLQASVGVSGRLDTHSDGGGRSDEGLATATRLSTRHALDLGGIGAAALSLSALFPAAESLGRGLSATTLAASVLGSSPLAAGGELSLEVGYRLDRTRKAVEDPFALSAEDRLSASLADYDAVHLGALVAVPVGRLTVLGEWSWDVGVLGSSPSPWQSPMRVSAGLQATLAERYVLSGVAGVSPSARPDFDANVRIDPRFWLTVSASVSFGAEERAGPRPPPPAPSTEATSVVTLRVLDARELPIPGARVAVTQNGRSQELTTDANGLVRIEREAGEDVELSIAAAGFVTRTLTVAPGAVSEELSLPMERALPEGEIKGRVRSLRGGPLLARIEVLPLGTAVKSASDGWFRVSVPPGEYTLRISAEGHDTQERAARVEERGVTILLVDLHKRARGRPAP